MNELAGRCIRPKEGTARKSRRSRNMEETPTYCFKVPDSLSVTISVKAKKDI